MEQPMPELEQEPLEHLKVFFYLIIICFLDHWFGPSNDPRGAGIGTHEAILLVWSHHREIIKDSGAVPNGWQPPKAT